MTALTRPRLHRRVIILAAVACLALAALGTLGRSTPAIATPSTSSLQPATPALTTDYHTFSLPPVALRPVTVSTASLRGSARSFKFISTLNTGPVRWNPCTRIGYRINSSGMTSADLAEVRAAFNRINQASGLAYTYRGATRWYYDSAGRTGPPPSDAALVFSFVQAGVEPYAPRSFTNTSLLGLGGPAWDSRGQIRQAMVLINRAGVKRLPTGTGPGTRMQVYVHEIGHATGLDHVGAIDQLMYPYFNRSLPPVLGAGDVSGLRRVGRPAGCMS